MTEALGKNNRIDNYEKVQFHVNQLKLIDLTNKYGIELHYPDEGAKGYPSYEAGTKFLTFMEDQVIDKMIEAISNPDILEPLYSSKSAKERQLYIRSLIDKKITYYRDNLSEKEKLNLFKFFKDTRDPSSQFFKERLEGDLKLGKKILKMVGNEKTVLFFGAVHLLGSDNDLTAALNDKEVFVISPFENEIWEMYFDYNNALSKEASSGLDLMQKPDMTFYINP